MFPEYIQVSTPISQVSKLKGTASNSYSCPKWLISKLKVDNDQTQYNEFWDSTAIFRQQSSILQGRIYVIPNLNS